VPNLRPEESLAPNEANHRPTDRWTAASACDRLHVGSGMIGYRDGGVWRLMRVVTIDGPAGAGKSTVARRVAERLGWRLLDTGAMYRAVALAALRGSVDMQSDAALAGLVETLTVELPPGKVLLNGMDVTADVRSVEVTRLTRHAADSPSVRRRLVEWQRRFASAERQVVTEGRDQGTIVFPDASCKFFLTATIEERARRRHAEFLARSESIPFQTVLDDLRDRDAQDAARAIAPMRPAADARTIDTTGMDLDVVVKLIEDEILSNDRVEGGCDAAVP
jgi:cytidylate kinase